MFKEIRYFCFLFAGWLMHLNGPIGSNQQAVTMPRIDMIDDTTLAYLYDPEPNLVVGGFLWDLTFAWFPPPDAEKPANPASNVRCVQVECRGGFVYLC